MQSVVKGVKCVYCVVTSVACQSLSASFCPEGWNRTNPASSALLSRAAASAEVMHVEPSEEAAEEMQVEPEGWEAPPAAPLAASSLGSTTCMSSSLLPAARL